MELVVWGNVQVSMEILMDGKVSPKLQQHAEGLNLLCIWAPFNKSVPKNEQKICPDILTSLSGNPDKGHLNSSEKAHKNSQKHFQVFVNSVTRATGQPVYANCHQETFGNTASKITVTLV